MKKIIVVFALLLSLSAIAQNFPEKRPELLLGKELKVKPLKENKKGEGYEYFYSDPKMRDSYLREKVYFSVTPAGGLVGRVFKVTAVDADPERKGKARLTLVDQTKGETIYYSYLSYLKHDFYFEVIGGLKLPTDLYCDFITEKKDKFTGETIYTTELLYLKTFTKIKKGAGAKYYMSISDYNKEEYLGKKGVIILLENNKRIDKPEVVIEVSPDGDRGFRYTATFELTLKDVNLLIDNKMTDTRIYIFDNVVSDNDCFYGMFGCLVTK